MGSQLTKSYDVESAVRASGGLNGVWKIYSATKKDKSRQRVSIFMFDKRLIEKKKSAAEREDLLQKMKSEVSSLMRIRHPSILRVVEPLMEDSKNLAFVTEHVESCLGDLIRKPVTLASEFSDMESRLGLLDLAQALHFLHSEARMVHTAVCPDNVYIVEGGKWKLSGLGFFQQLMQDQTARIPDSIDHVLGAKSQRYSESEIPSVFVPPLHFTAPEIVATHVCTGASDMFSLGCLIFSLYKAASTSQAIDHHLLRITDFSQNGHRNACTEAQYSIGTSVTILPEDFREIVARLTALSPSDRPTLHNFTVSRPFLDPFIKSLYFLEHIHEKQETQKVQFLKGLAKVIEKFDPRLLLKRVLPTLVQLMEQDTLAPSILPNVLGILRYSKVPTDIFQNLIWPGIVKLATGREIPAQCLFLLLSEMDLVMSFTSVDQCKQVLMPLVFKGYDCGVAQLQELVLRKTPEIATKLTDTGYLKVQILPRFLQALIAARAVSVREAGLRSLSKIYQFFDRSTLVDTVLPMLEKVRKLDVSSEICMQLLEVYEGIGKMLGHRTVALNILPSLIPLLVESDLTKQEFEKLCSTIDSLATLVKEARKQELLTIKEVEPKSKPLDLELGGGKEEDPAESFFKEMFSGGSEDQGNIFAGMEVKDSRGEAGFGQLQGGLPHPPQAAFPQSTGNYGQGAPGGLTAPGAFQPTATSFAPPPASAASFSQPSAFPQMSASAFSPQTAASTFQPQTAAPAFQPQSTAPSFQPQSAVPAYGKGQYAPSTFQPPSVVNTLQPSFSDPFAQPAFKQSQQDAFSLDAFTELSKTQPPRLQKPPSASKPISEPAFQAFPPMALSQPTPIWSPPSYSAQRAPDDFFPDPQQSMQPGQRNNPFAAPTKPPSDDPFFGL